MLHKIFNIYDQKAHAYLPPFTLPTADMAIRTFADCVNSKDHAFGRHPSDYTLFEGGDYDDSNGQISPYPTPVVLGTGVEFLHSNSPEKYNGDLPTLSNDAPIQPSTSG